MIPIFQRQNLAPWQFPEVLDYWDANAGISQATATERVSAWAPSYKGADSLDQGTAANQPILLPYSGTNYLWLPGVNGNTASTPNAAAVDITGDIDLRAYVALNDWTPSAAQMLIQKDAAADPNRAWEFYIATNGTVHFAWSPTGNGANFIDKASTAAPTVSDFGAIWIRVTLDVDNGAVGNDVKFYTSPDGSTWTQLGTTVTTAGTTSIASTTAIIGIGGALSITTGKFYRAQIYNGIDGTKVFDANFTQVAEGATTFTESSSNGATVTINSTGTKPAQIVGSQQLLFDGTAYTLSTGAITLNQPISLVLVGKQISWTGNDLIIDGNTANTLGLKQTTGTPSVSINAGSAAAENSGWALNTNACIGVILNGASSQIQVNLGTATTGNAGAGNPSGLFVGSNATPAAFGNFQAKAIGLCNSALSQARLNQLIVAMAAQKGLSF